MNGGMYSALAGNLAAMQRLDVIASNLANVNTSGFKKDRLAFESVLAGTRNPPAVPSNQTADPVLLQGRMVTDHSAGAMVQTGNPLDMALQGDGFLWSAPLMVWPTPAKVTFVCPATVPW